jgi:hypothetical protein
MTDKNPHLSSNRLIAKAFESGAIGKPGECVIGTKDGKAIISLHFEVGSEPEPGVSTIRAVCKGSNDTIVEIFDAVKLEDVHDFLVNQCEIAPARVQHEFSKFVETRVTQPLPWKQRFDEAEEWNLAQRQASPEMINQFEASGLMYSVIHRPAFRIVEVDHRKDRTNPEFYTVYVQNTAIEDPDQCLVDTDSFETLFEAVGFCRTHIEQRLFKAFMPELMK